jgi:exonuclease III
MKVVAWNMAHRIASWAVLKELGADIALLSEARVLKTVKENVIGGVKTEGRDGYRRSWAAAVVSSHTLREIGDARAVRDGRAVKIPFEKSRPGSWVAAVATVPVIGEVTAISMYGLMDEKSDASVHRSLSELTPVFEDARYNGQVLLGGDLNVWTGWEAGPRLDRSRVVLERIRAFGLVDCLEARHPQGRLEGCPCIFGEGCTHSRTRMDPSHPDIPYQMDYLYASPALVQHLESCEAMDPERLRSKSDHYPIVALF